MLHQPLHAGNAITEGGRRLKAEPGIKNHRPVLPAVMEGGHRRSALGGVLALQSAQAGTGQGHRWAMHRSGRLRAGTQIAGGGTQAPGCGGEQSIPHPMGPGLEPLGTATLQALLQRPLQRGPEAGLQLQESVEESCRIAWATAGHGGILELRQAWQGQQGTAVGVAEAHLRQDPLEGGHQALLQLIIRAAGGAQQHPTAQQGLAGIPAGEGIAVAGKQVQQLADRPLQLQLHRR